MTRALTIHQNNIHLFFQMLEENVGIALDHSKEYLVASRLAVIARANHFKDHHALIQHLLVNPIGILHHQSFQAMTTNETMFFRDKFPFDTLRTTIIPALIAKCRDTKTLSIWCAAASSGQEPYSLAILLRENFPELYYWKINFIATDISEPALKQARSGTYSETEIKRGLTDEQIKRLKGEKRPINSLKDRLKMLIHFDFIDSIIIYDEINDDLESELDNIINIINPCVWFKGTDYKQEDILRKHPSIKNIKLIDLIEGKSTTNIINKINK